MRTTRIAIVYHSGFGHTARQAQAVKAAGVQLVPGAEALLMTTDDAQSRWEDLAAAEAIIFGSPTYMASASAQFKAFAESSSPAVFAKGLACKNKLAAGFTNSGAQSGDKLATLTQIALFAAQHGMHWVSLGSDRSTATGEEVNRLGVFLGAAAQSNFGESPETAPPESDLATARYLGRRVADQAVRILGADSAHRGLIARAAVECGS